MSGLGVGTEAEDLFNSTPRRQSLLEKAKGAVSALSGDKLSGRRGSWVLEERGDEDFYTPFLDTIFNEDSSGEEECQDPGLSHRAPKKVSKQALQEPSDALTFFNSVLSRGDSSSNEVRETQKSTGSTDTSPTSSVVQEPAAWPRSVITNHYRPAIQQWYYNTVLSVFACASAVGALVYCFAYYSDQMDVPYDGIYQLSIDQWLKDMMAIAMSVIGFAIIETFVEAVFIVLANQLLLGACQKMPCCREKEVMDLEKPLLAGGANEGISTARWNVLYQGAEQGPKASRLALFDLTVSTMLVKRFCVNHHVLPEKVRVPVSQMNRRDNHSSCCLIRCFSLWCTWEYDRRWYHDEGKLKDRHAVDKRAGIKNAAALMAVILVMYPVMHYLNGGEALGKVVDFDDPVQASIGLCVEALSLFLLVRHGPNMLDRSNFFKGCLRPRSKSSESVKEGGLCMSLQSVGSL